jgi:drug/metabolite transporter (DMT)-like permease
MFLSFATVASLPLADAVLLGYAAPLITVVLGRALLDERVPGYRWLAAIAGGAGVVVALWPHMNASNGPVPLPGTLVGVGAGLGAALFAAVSVIQIRSLAVTEPPEAIAFYYTLTTGALGAASICLGWVMPDLHQLALLMSAGLFGGAANLFTAKSLRHAHASVTAPFEYTTLVWSALISWCLFGQPPGGALLAGGALIAASGLYALWHETRLSRLLEPSPKPGAASSAPSR